MLFISEALILLPQQRNTHFDLFQSRPCGKSPLVHHAHSLFKICVPLAPVGKTRLQNDCTLSMARSFAEEEELTLTNMS